MRLTHKLQSSVTKLGRITRYWSRSKAKARVPSKSRVVEYLARPLGALCVQRRELLRHPPPARQHHLGAVGDSRLANTPVRDGGGFRHNKAPFRSHSCRSRHTPSNVIGY